MDCCDDSPQIYVNAYRQPEDGHFLVDIETLIILNIHKITNNNNDNRIQLYIKLLNGEIQNGGRGDQHGCLATPESWVKADLTDLKFRIISDNDELPSQTLLCKWPVLVLQPGYVIAGLCSVARQLVKTSQNKRIRKLLGFRKNCLNSCSESSIWTRFCEIDMISTVTGLLNDRRQFDNDSGRFQIPPDIFRFEYHLKTPVRMHNVYKIAREHNNEPEISSQVPVELLNLSHTYGEGLYMTLADVILYPCLQIFFQLFPQDSVKVKLPLVTSWFETMYSKNLHPITFDCRPETLNFVEVMLPKISEKSLYTSDPDRYKHGQQRFFTKQTDVLDSLKTISHIDITNRLFPFGDDLAALDWSAVPTDCSPVEFLPSSRSLRKRHQLENLAKAVIKLAGARKNLRIVDFCSGSGHLGILLAHLLPGCQITLIENKEMSLVIARKRISSLGLKNARILQSNLDYFRGRFDIGVSLHACGVATDLVIDKCLGNRAHFVCCPCCYGGIRDSHHVTYPRSAKFKNLSPTKDFFFTLAHAADQTHDLTDVKTTQGFVCMDAIDTDRKLHAEGCGYEVHLGKLQPFSCTNKNNLLVGICKDNSVVEDDSDHFGVG